MVEFGAGDYPRAERSATAAIRLVPFIPTAYLIRGASRFAHGRRKLAFSTSTRRSS